MDINAPEKTNGYLGEGLRGPAWTIAGVTIGGLVVEALKNGGILGGRQDCATQRDLAYERELTKANAETAALKAQLDCRAEVLAAERRFEDKLDAIEAQIGGQQVLNAKMQGFMETLAGQVASFDRMTARFITQPVMAASEAALTIGPFAKTATASAGTQAAAA
jgi:hypothetical protein